MGQNGGTFSKEKMQDRKDKTDVLEACSDSKHHLKHLFKKLSKRSNGWTRCIHLSKDEMNQVIHDITEAQNRLRDIEITLLGDEYDTSEDETNEGEQ